MKRVFKYGFFRDMDPVCPSRIRQYPELADVAAAVREGRPADPEDLKDLQHQWAYSCSTRMMQRCFEEDCDAVRPVPFHGYSGEDQVAIMRFVMAQHGSTATINPN